MITKTKRIRKRNAGRLFLLTLAGILIVSTIAFLNISNLRLSQKRSELGLRAEELKKEIKRLEGENAELREKIAKARSEEYLEKVAKEQLGLKRVGEEVLAIVKEGLEKNKNQEQKAEEKSFWEKILQIFKL